MDESSIKTLKKLIKVHGWKWIVKDIADLARDEQRENGQKQFNGMDIAGRLNQICFNLPTKKEG